MADENKKGPGGKRLSDELLDDDFFKPPVEAESGGAEEPAEGGKPAKVPMTPPGAAAAPTRPSPRPRRKKSTLPLTIVIVLLIVAIAGVAAYLFAPEMLAPILGTQDTGTARPATQTPRFSTTEPIEDDVEEGTEGEAGAAEGGQQVEIKDFYQIHLGPYPAESEDAQKVIETLELYNLANEETRNVREYETYKLYLKQAFTDQAEAQAAVEELSAFDVDPSIARDAKGNYVILLGEGDNKAELVAAAEEIEEDGEWSTALFTRSHEEVSLAWQLKDEYSYEADALETMKILKDGGLKPRLNIVKREVPAE